MFFKSRTSRKQPLSTPRRRRFFVERLEERSLLAVMALKTDSFAPVDDLNGNGNIDPGEAITYTVSVQNPGGPTATNVTFSDTPGANTTLIVGSVTTNFGAVTSGNLAGQTSVGVNLGQVPSGANISISFKARVNNPLPAGVTEVSNQGTLSHVLAHQPTLGQCFNTAFSTPLGQEIRPQAASLNFVDLFIEDAGSDIGPGANLQVRLRANSIAGPTVATSLVEFVPDGTNTGGGSTITRFSFAAPVNVTPGAVYVIEIVRPDPVVGGNSNFMMCGGRIGTNSYADGRAITNGTLRDDFDFWFRLGGSQLTDDPDVAGAANPTMTPLGGENAPRAVTDRYIDIFEDTPYTRAAPGVLGNDTDLDGDPLTAMLVSGPANGQLTLMADGSFTYTPNLNFFGADSFVYRASDGELTSLDTTVFLQVQPVNDPPVLSDATFTLDENSPVGTVIGTLMASDVEGQQLFYFIESGNASGAFALDVNTGVLTVADSPPLDFETTPQFTLTIRVRDFGQASSTATVRVNLANVNEAPTLAGATFSLAENSPAGTAVGAVTGADVDGDSLSYAIVGGNAAGAFQIDPSTGALSVANSAPLDFETTPQFTLSVETRDPGGLAATAPVVIDLLDRPELTTLMIDIRPGDGSNQINIKSHGKLDVAIYSTAGFDVMDIDVASLTFGRTGDEDSLSRTPHGPRFRYADLNGDGLLDLLATFEIELTGFDAGDTLGTLKARTRGGAALMGSDVVSIKSPGK